MECGDYRRIKLMAHTMKLSEKIIDERIRQIVELDDILDLGKAGRQQRRHCLSHNAVKVQRERKRPTFFWLICKKRPMTAYQGT